MSTATAPAPAVDPSRGDAGRSPVWVRRVYGANLVAQCAIVVTGAVVRLTGSGLGCPTWPRCTEGSFVPVASQDEGFHKWIEFGNRTLTFVLGLLAILAIVAAWRDARRRRSAGLPRRRALTVLAVVPFLGTVAQAILGGITVLTGLHPLIVAAHFLLSLVIIAFVTVLLWRAGEPGDQPVEVVVRREIRWGVRILVAVMAAVIVVGTIVTASGPHAGDADVARLGLDPQTVSWLHADLVLLGIGLLVGLLIALRATHAPRRPVVAAQVALAVFLAQGLVGYVQYFTSLPWVLVAFHVLGAVLVWWTTIRLLLATRARGAVAESADAVSDPAAV